MALVRFRHASIYLRGVKVAEAYESEEDISSGDEPQFGDEGFVGMSDGATTTTFNFTAIVPVKGMTIAVEDILLQKQDVDLALGLVNGRIHQVTVRCTNANYKSDAKAGTLVGSFKFMGGVPKPV